MHGFLRNTASRKSFLAPDDRVTFQGDHCVVKFDVFSCESGRTMQQLDGVIQELRACAI
jgi:hypothetical protein